MRITTLALALGVALLAGCPGSVIEPLPPGGGAGTYFGQFTADETDALAGEFELTIDGVGAASGTGILDGRSVALTGLLTAGELDGTITDTVTQLSGRFDGSLFGGLLAGDFRLPQPDGDDLTGLWDAAPAS